MKLKTLPLVLSALLLSGASILAVAADDYPTKPTADQGMSPSQPDKAKSDQGDKGTDQGMSQDDKAKSDQGTQAAKPAGNDAAAQMRGLDTDGNGLISKTEAEKMKGLSDQFDVVDKDKDGTLDASEFAAAVLKIKK